MSEKFEQCSLQEATHVKMGGKVHKLGDGEIVTKMEHPYGYLLGVWSDANFQYINENSFTTFGIKPLKEKKREPIEFEAIVRKSIGLILFLGDVPEGTRVGTKFKCVEILEEK